MMRRFELLILFFSFNYTDHSIRYANLSTLYQRKKKKTMIFGHYNHQLHPGTLAHGSQVPGLEFFFASQSDLRGIAQKAVVSIRTDLSYTFFFLVLFDSLFIVVYFICLFRL